LDCELVYALVPRRPLEDILDDRIRTVAEAQLRRVDHSMWLDGQPVSDEATQEQLTDTS